MERARRETLFIFAALMAFALALPAAAAARGQDRRHDAAGAKAADRRHGTHGHARGHKGKGKAKGKSARKRPNLVLIITDDQTLEQFSPLVMPKAESLLVNHGTTFSQGIVSSPQCGPSRAQMLTGQYAHNNGYTSDREGYAGLEQARRVLPEWLRKAGYKTIHVGKYMNGYTKEHGLEPAPGWDRWATTVTVNYTDPVFSIDGKTKAPGTYLTKEINHYADKFVHRYAPRRRPFYMQIEQSAPHVGGGGSGTRCQGAAIPAARDADAFADAVAPSNPATAEDDVSDKPEFIQRVPLSVNNNVHIDRDYSCGLASLQSVDRGVASLIGALRRSGELRKTMIAFVSDNGYSFREHRMPLTKGLPYEEDMRVPFVIRPPANFPKRFRQGASVDAPVSNVDLAPTLLQLAGADSCAAGHCRRMDGRSLVPLLQGRDPSWTADRAIETSFDIGSPTYKRSCRWEGYRTPVESVTEHLLLPEVGGRNCEPASFFETYDLPADPFELANSTASTAPSADVEHRLDRLSRCSGIKGRDKRRHSTPFCE